MSRIEIFSSLLMLGLFWAASASRALDATLVIFMAVGALGGSLLGAMGGKQFGLLDFGQKTVTAKIAGSLAVVLGVGPACLDYAVHNYPREVTGVSAEATASLIGFCLTLFGTSFLIMVVPVFVMLFKHLLQKWIPVPPATLPNTTTGNTSNTPQ